MHSQTPLRRQNSFDALRLLFALFVIFTHSYALLLLPDPLEVISGFRYDFGKLGVTGFFAISGYLVTQSWLRNPNPFRFVLARALRIFPAFWVALLFSVLIAATVTTNAYEFLSGPYTWRWVSRNALFIWQGFGTGMPGAFEGNPLPGDHWWYAPLQMAIALGIVRLANSQCLTRLAFRSGDYSYGLYVYAFPLQQFIIALLGDAASPLLVCSFTVTSTLPFAILSWHSVEKWALRWVQTISVRWPITNKQIYTGQP